VTPPAADRRDARRTQQAAGAPRSVPPALAPAPPAFALDQIDVAFSALSTDHLEGLVAGRQISTS
jgi:hypothetical protein